MTNSSAAPPVRSPRRWSSGPWRALVVVALLLRLLATVGAVDQPLHPEDYRSCSTCRAALEKAQGYLAKHYQAGLADRWYAGMLNSFWVGFYCLMDDTKEKEARTCATNMIFYITNWAKNNGGYEGWFCSMGMLYLSEFSLRFGATPEIKAALEWGAKYCHKTREDEGGWFHGPRWGAPNYALDISSVGCGYFAALHGMRSLGLETGIALDEADDYISKICDGRSVAYGLHGRGGFSLGASAYVLLGLTSSGNASDPRVKGIGGFLTDNLQKIRSAHASGMIHHFGVAAALHRTGPEAYSRFAGYYLHQYFIPNQNDDGSIAPFPNDNNDPPEKAYATLKTGGDMGATAILAAMILMERPGTFSGTPAKKPGSPPNKQCFKQAQELIAKGSLGAASELLAEVLPCGVDDALVPRAQAQRRLMESSARHHIQLAMDAVEKAEQAASEALDGAADQAEACQRAVTVCECVDKAFRGSPLAGEAKARIAELKKRLAILRVKRPGTVNKRLGEIAASDKATEDADGPASPAHLAEILAAGAESPSSADAAPVPAP